jgi:hypothetical protein
MMVVNTGIGAENLMKFDAVDYGATGFLLTSSLVRGHDSRAHGVWKVTLERADVSSSIPSQRPEWNFGGRAP